MNHMVFLPGSYKSFERGMDMLRVEEMHIRYLEVSIARKKYK